MLIGDLFEKEVTRAIPPVVYFHEQEPAELKREVEEYIITGGYPAGDPRATEGGIHEQFVRLLSAMHRELQKPGDRSCPRAGSPAFTAPASRASRSSWGSRSTAGNSPAGSRSPRRCSPRITPPARPICAPPGSAW